MAIVRDEGKKYIFLLAPGTGSTAVSETLVARYGGRWLPEQDVRNERGELIVRKKHTTLNELRRLGLDDGFIADALVFTAVRNPFDFWVSQWMRSKLRWSRFIDDPKHPIHNSADHLQSVINARDMEFPEWLDDRLGQRYRNSVRQFMHPEYVTPEVDCFLRFENLQADLVATMKRLGEQEIADIPATNVTSERDRDYTKYYDAKSRELVETVFRPYLKRFDYRF